MTLPGTPGDNVYQQLPSDGDVGRMAAPSTGFASTAASTSAVMVVQLPFWTALAEKLREGSVGRSSTIAWTITPGFRRIARRCAGGRSDRRRGRSGRRDGRRARRKVRAKARRTAIIRNACDYEHFAVGLDSSEANQ